VKFHISLPQHILGYQKMFALPVPSLRNHRRMLAKQQDIPNRISLARRHDTLLQRVRIRVSNQS
jgi:hypothetical protein